MSTRPVRGISLESELHLDPVLTINGGSSTVKFALFRGGRRVGKGQVESRDSESVIGKVHEMLADASPGAIAHRIVHGGLRLHSHQVITPEVMTELREAKDFDLAHLPAEISLIEVFGKAFEGVPQVACFDSSFHREIPRVAQLYGIPRRYLDSGVRRLGFHGLSYEYLMQELREQGGETEARGRVVMAHLGSGSSMAGVLNGRAMDTTMGFTPLAGLVMGTRPGDFDPGLVTYIMRNEGLNPGEMENLLNVSCGLKGVSDRSSDMRELLAHSQDDVRAREAVELFCYQARKQLGGLMVVLGGLDTLVFSGGIGEHSPEIRAGICEGLGFIGLELDPSRNAASQPVISSNQSRIIVRVIATDEESVMAQIVCKLLSAQERNQA